jgi:hypothetical protein
MLLESEKEKFSELNKQSLSILEDKLKVASEAETRLRAELAAEKKACEEKVAETRAQARSEASDRESRLKDVTQQLDAARSDVFVAKNEAESFRFVSWWTSFSDVTTVSHGADRQANLRLQSELDSNSVSFDERLAVSTAAAAAEREQMRSQIESLEMKLKEQVCFCNLKELACFNLTLDCRNQNFAPPFSKKKNRFSRLRNFFKTPRVMPFNIQRNAILSRSSWTCSRSSTRSFLRPSRRPNPMRRQAAPSSQNLLPGTKLRLRD